MSSTLPINEMNSNRASYAGNINAAGDNQPKGGKKSDKANDPKDDLSGAEFNQSLEFFARWGFRNFLRESLIQTVKDVIAVRENRHVAPEIHVSARWAQTPKGEAAIEFLMPDFPAEVIVARLYSDPVQFLSFLNGAEKSAPEETSSQAAGSIGASNSIHLNDNLAAHAFGEKPEVNENDLPLSRGESHFDQFPIGSPMRTMGAESADAMVHYSYARDDADEDFTPGNSDFSPGSP